LNRPEQEKQRVNEKHKEDDVLYLTEMRSGKRNRFRFPCMLHIKSPIFYQVKRKWNSEKICLKVKWMRN